MYKAPDACDINTMERTMKSMHEYFVNLAISVTYACLQTTHEEKYI
jgi:hypothetical protein